MAHLTCVHHVRTELVEILEDYKGIGVENLLALGGDPDPERGHVGELRYAIELVELAREVGDFSIGVAAHPAGHPLSPDLATDRRHLAEKLRIADFAITQLFFDAADWRRLVDELGELGVEKPVLPGIMPITTVASMGKMRDLGGVVPAWLVDRLQAAQENGPKAVRAAGVAASTALCEELLELGAPGLHFFTMNRSTATREIFASLQHD
jgi:methylenetetrahydrofolate reductase (NADPH)